MRLLNNQLQQTRVRANRKLQLKNVAVTLHDLVFDLKMVCVLIVTAVIDQGTGIIVFCNSILVRIATSNRVATHSIQRGGRNDVGAVVSEQTELEGHSLL
jgi:hypothetical protein